MGKHTAVGDCCSDTCCRSMNCETSGPQPVNQPQVVDSHPKVTEIGVQTSCSFQELLDGYKRQQHAVGVQGDTIECPDEFLEDIDIADIIEPDLNVVEMGAQTNCSLEELLMHAEEERDALKLHRDTLEQINAFLEDRLLFMETQLKLVLDSGSVRGAPDKDRNHHYLKPLPHGDSAQPDHCSNGQDDDIDPFLLRIPPDTKGNPSMSKPGSCSPQELDIQRAGSLSSISTAASLSLITVRDVSAGSSSEHVSSTWSSLCSSAHSFAGTHVDILKSRLQRLHITQDTLKNQLPSLWASPIMQTLHERGRLPWHCASAPTDEIHELSRMSCLWFSLKSNDTVVGYACGSASTESDRAVSELENGKFFEGSESIISNGMPQDGLAHCSKSEYSSLRHQAFLRSKQKDFLTISLTGGPVCRQNGDGVHLQSADCAASNFSRCITEGDPWCLGKWRSHYQFHCQSQCRMGEPRRIRNDSSDITLKLAQAAPPFQLRRRSTPSVAALQPPLTPCVGLGALLPDDSLFDATEIWNSQFDVRPTHDLRMKPTAQISRR